MENVTLEMRKRTKEKTLFVVLCVAIALVILTNVFALSSAYFTDSSSATVSLQMGNVDVVGKVWNGSSYVDGPLTLSAGTIYPGSTTEQRIYLKNNGNASFYLRFDYAFEIGGVNNSTTKSFLNITSISNNSFAKSTVDNKYYYKGTLASLAEITDIRIAFAVSQSLGNSDLQNTVNYQNASYKILINVDVVQAANVALDTTDVDDMATNWPV